MNNKHIFWIALVSALVIFWTGILVGVFFENSRVSFIKETYFNSETDMFDFQLASQLSFGSNLTCKEINNKASEFADKIYNQSVQLEKYDNSNKLTDQFIPIHKRYDLLRVSLWNEIIKNKGKCNSSINTVVYLYNYRDYSLNGRATQGAFGNYLGDLKNKYNDSIILIPIAADTGVESLNVIRASYNIDKTPVVIVNEKYKFESLESLKDINIQLDKNIKKISVK